MRFNIGLSFVFFRLGFTEVFSNVTSNWSPWEGMGEFRRCLLLQGRAEKLTSRDHKSEQYNKLNQPWNLRKAKPFPLGYFLPTTATDVSHAVKCGVKAKVHLIPNSGGHSYESLGWGTNDTVVVDFRNMAKVRVEGSGSEAVGILEPGTNIGQITAYLWEHGGYGLPMGDCLTVGIGGHAIGGGYGYYAPLFGLTLDNVLEVEIVDANGDIVVANKDKNPDLFWALRGSGPGYIGIVTGFKVKIFEASKAELTLVRIQATKEHFAHTYVAFQNFQAWAKDNEPSAFMSFVLTSGSHEDNYYSDNIPLLSGMLVTAVHIRHPTAQPNGNATFLKAIHDYFPKPAEILAEIFPNYIQMVAMTGYAPLNLPHPTTGKVFPVGNLDRYFNIAVPRLPTEKEAVTFLKLMRKENPIKRYFKAKAFLIRQYFTVKQMEPVGKLLPEMPHSIWVICTTQQGLIQSVPRNATSYVHRDAKFDFSIQYEDSDDPAQVAKGMKYLYKLWDAVQFMDGGETYQNYPDLDLKDSLDRHFKENYPRLVSQKQKWDPKNYFVSDLSIPVKPKQEL